MKRGRAATTLTRTWLGPCLLIALVAIWQLPSLVQASGKGHDYMPHQLQNTVLCVDDDSVVIHLENVAAGRSANARNAVVNDLKGALTSILKSSGVRADFAPSCAGRQGYVVVVARVTGLDANLYKRYGRQAFSYALSVQVGDYASQDYLVSNYILPNQGFDGFFEEAFSERQHAPFEESIQSHTRGLLASLAEAWHEDNP